VHRAIGMVGRATAQSCIFCEISMSKHVVGGANSLHLTTPGPTTTRQPENPADVRPIRTLSNRHTTFRPPPRCGCCHAEGTIVPRAKIDQSAVALWWYCERCQAEWPLTGAEYHKRNRRTGERDRRRRTRTDRRGSKDRE
jgi:hypothetical protein